MLEAGAERGQTVSKRAVGILMVLPLILGSGLVCGCTAAHGASGAGSTAWGHERWPVKTLQDSLASSFNSTATATTVDHLRGLTRPHLAQNAPRQPGLERTTYRVNAQLVGFKFEADSDIHLVIADPSNRAHTMIV